MRLKVFGFALLLVSSASLAAAEGRDAEQIFNSYCFSCHGTGWDNAPVLGDGFAWEERLSKGFETLLKNTINGFNTMPPRGNCFDCSDEELKAAVEFLIAE